MEKKRTKIITETITHEISADDVEEILINHFRTVACSNVSVYFDCSYSNFLRGATITETIRTEE
jgi:hypothetical protein